jgi:phenylacetate-coenzyme A ligase PaaK-like adenylate-forming protein
MATYEELRRRHTVDAATLVPEMEARIDWPADRLAEFRRSELRRLLRVAKYQSPWHRKRLADVDPDEIDEDGLSELPVMTKQELMEHFDEIVLDDRLRLDVVEAHLERVTAGDGYLFDRYHACASGGSSGLRGVFVYDWDGWTASYGSLVRFELRARRLDPELAAAPKVYAVVTSQAGTHMASSLPQTFATADGVWHRFPVTLPLAEIVAGLNAARPTVLWGYATALHSLAHEAAAGRLRIRPRRVISSSEPLLPEIRTALEETWNVPVINIWGTSEAACATACGASPGAHLSDDLAIVEPVDVGGRPVLPGTRSDKIYLTNLFNHALPLIRYEITDQLTLLDETCPCGSVFGRIEDPHGRLDDMFEYADGLTVHPHVFRSPLSHRREIVEYQVRQTARGAAVAVRCAAPLDLAALEAEIADGLARLGLAAPEVSVTAVDGIGRDALSGKLKRFVPLPV